MDDNITNKNENESSKPVKESKDNKKKDKKNNSRNLLAEYKAEFRKIVWSSRQDVLKQTATVIVISLLVGAVIFGMDTCFGFAITKLSTILA